MASFEAWDPAGRAFDAVISGQTWHWVEAQGASLLARRGPAGHPQLSGQCVITL